MLRDLWNWSRTATLAIIGSIFAGLVLSVFGGWYLLWVNKVENYEMAFVFNWRTGKIEEIDKKGWVICPPLLYSVHKIDLRPHQLTITANQRVLNAKLVRFEPKGLQTFLAWHGRSAGDDTEALMEILKSYAFDPANGKDCPFLTVIQEITANQGAEPVSQVANGGR